MPRLLELRRLAVLNIFESSLRYCLRLKIELPCGKGAMPVAHMAPRFALDVANLPTPNPLNGAK